MIIIDIFLLYPISVMDLNENDIVNVKDLSLNESPFKECDLQVLKLNDSTCRQWQDSPFQIRDDINKKVVIYDKDVKQLKADAIVNPTNESLTQLDFVNHMAGLELENYIRRKVRQCATGEVKLTPGFRSNYKYILHAVPPKYQAKYKTAAETALFHTYFRILETMIERKIRTAVIPTLATPKCNLPFDDNFHMQLRIIRRMLEKKGSDFDRIVISISNGQPYAKIFFSYFPRTNLDLELACFHLGPTVGGSNGEPIIPEREIRIKPKPAAIVYNHNHNLTTVTDAYGLSKNVDYYNNSGGSSSYGRGYDGESPVSVQCDRVYMDKEGSSSHYERSIDLTSGLDLSTVVGRTEFSKMRDDLDKKASPVRSASGANTGCSIF